MRQPVDTNVLAELQEIEIEFWTLNTSDTTISPPHDKRPRLCVKRNVKEAMWKRKGVNGEEKTEPESLPQYDTVKHATNNKAIRCK